jgi:transcriptional regulator with XRE-family HTH domain
MTAKSREPVALGEDPSAASVAFGQRLREVRADAGLSQDTLAERAGVHATAIGRMERGGREPRLATILRLARALGVQPGTLLDELDDPPATQ